MYVYVLFSEQLPKRSTGGEWECFAVTNWQTRIMLQVTTYTGCAKNHGLL